MKKKWRFYKDFAVGIRHRLHFGFVYEVWTPFQGESVRSLLESKSPSFPTYEAAFDGACFFVDSEIAKKLKEVR